MISGVGALRPKKPGGRNWVALVQVTTFRVYSFTNIFFSNLCGMATYLSVLMFLCVSSTAIGSNGADTYVVHNPHNVEVKYVHMVK